MMVKKDNPLFEMIPPDVLRKAKILSDECLIEAEVKESVKEVKKVVAIN